MSKIKAAYSCAGDGWGPYHVLIPGPVTGQDSWGPVRDRDKDKTLCGIRLTDMWERDVVGIEKYRIECKRCRAMLEKKGEFGKHMKLLPDHVMEMLPPLGSQDSQSDPTAYVKYFKGMWTWYATEGDAIWKAPGIPELAQGELGCVDRAQIEDVRFFGLVDGAHEELGFFTLKELKGIGVDRDTHFQPRLLSEISG